MKVWHLYKEYYLLKTEQGNLEQKLEYMALFSTNEDGTYDDKDRHIDIVYDRFAHDVIDRIKDNINFEFAYDIDKITDVLNEKNLIKKINMIKDIPEEATTQKIIYKLEENIANEEGLLEIYTRSSYFRNGYSRIIINTTKINCFEEYCSNSYNDFKSGFSSIHYSKSNIFIAFSPKQDNLDLVYGIDLSFFNSYDSLNAVIKKNLLQNINLTPKEYINLLLSNILFLLKFKKIEYRYMSIITEITIESHLKSSLNSLICFARDYCSEADISETKLNKDSKDIIKLSIRIGKSSTSSTSTENDKMTLNKILHRRAKSMKDEDIINSFARAS